jgi:hypothetical protein
MTAWNLVSLLLASGMPFIGKWLGNAVPEELDEGMRYARIASIACICIILSLVVLYAKYHIMDYVIVMLGTFIVLGLLLGIESARKKWMELGTPCVVICVLLLSLHMILRT